MQVAIGIRRAVMEDEFFPAPRGGAELVVKAHILPALNELWLEDRQPAAHREVGFRQEDGRTVIRRHGLAHGIKESNKRNAPRPSPEDGPDNSPHPYPSHH